MFVFILFFLPEVALVTDWQKFFVSFSFIAYLGVSDNDQTYQYDTPCAFKLCTLEINSKGRFKRKHVESCSSTTTNIISSLQYL